MAVDAEGGLMALTVRVAVKGKWSASDDIVNVFTFNSTGATDPPQTSLVTTWLNTFYTANLISIMSTGVAFDRYVIEKAVAGSWVYVDEVAYSKVGTNSAEPLPHMCAYMITGICAGKYRGKKFIPGITEASQNNGIIEASSLAYLATVATAYVTGFDDAGVTWIPGVCDKTASRFSAFTGARVDNRVHALNKRFPGRGS